MAEAATVGRTSPSDPALRRSPLVPAVVFGATWLAWFGVLQWSVVRFRTPIVLTLTLGAVLLVLWLARRVRVGLPSRVAAVVLLGSVVLTLTVPLFSYLRGGWLTAALTVVTVGGVVTAGLLALSGRAAALAAFGMAMVGQAVLTAVTVVGDPAPRIDVWVILQQGADLTARLGNVYTATWTGSPGVQDHFTYLPWMAVLTAPGRWVAGDVRWMIGIWSLVLLAGLWTLAGGRRGDVARGAAVVGLVVFAPGTITQVDQAWTEPVLAALLVWWAVLVRRGHAWWAVIPLALACASKQHLALLAPVLLLWHPFGWRRTLVTGGVAGVLLSPWLLADPAAFVDDTVTTLLTFHPIEFANTWYLYFLNVHGVELPFAVTGLFMVGAVGVAAWMVWRRRPGVDEVLLWLAFVLAVANLVNKQAFYNQFWLVAVLVAAAVAAAGPPTGTDEPPEEAGDPVSAPAGRGAAATDG